MEIFSGFDGLHVNLMFSESASILRHSEKHYQICLQLLKRHINEFFSKLKTYTKQMFLLFFSGWPFLHVLSHWLRLWKYLPLTLMTVILDLISTQNCDWLTLMIYVPCVQV